METTKIVNIISQLCEQNNISINQMLKNCGLAKSVIDNLKKGSIPSADKILTIADYFDVSTDYLLGKTDIKKLPSSEDDGSDLSNVYFSLAKEAQKDGIDPRDIKLAIETIRRLREK